MQAPIDLENQLVSELKSREGTGKKVRLPSVSKGKKKRKEDKVHGRHQVGMHVGHTSHDSRLRRVLLMSVIG